MADLQKDVRELHDKFGILAHVSPGHLTRRKLRERVECMLEELSEFATACGLQICDDLKVVDHQAGRRNDLVEQADALIDLVYFAVGTAVMLGIPFQALWDDVHRANMAKERGVTRRGHQVDLVKPPGWVGPQTYRILRARGYNPADWTDPEYTETFGDLIDEEKCRDDQAL